MKWGTLSFSAFEHMNNSYGAEVHLWSSLDIDLLTPVVVLS